MATIVLYNSYAANYKGFEFALKIKEISNEEFEFVDLVTIENKAEFLAKYPSDQKFIIAGGDGTLNKFVNSLTDDQLPQNLFYFPCGTGNDFYNDILTIEPGVKIVDVRKYLINLPVATIKGVDYKFFNGIGYGIDGYCCEKADILKEKGVKNINYTTIAIKGLLFFFKPRGCKVTVDDKTYEFKNVWLAPMMKGKYFGGGMMPTPNQDRRSGLLSVLVWHEKSALKTLTVFPQIFNGGHIKKTKLCTLLTGKHITVEYEKPCAAQVDGETVLDVSKVEVRI